MQAKECMCTALRRLFSGFCTMCCIVLIQAFYFAPNDFRQEVVCWRRYDTVLPAEEGACDHECAVTKIEDGGRLFHARVLSSPPDAHGRAGQKGGGMPFFCQRVRMTVAQTNQQSQASIEKGISS